MNDENNSYFDTLEDFVAEELLIELFNSKKAEVFENVVFEGKKRYYIEDLTRRDYNLENTTPYQLSILDNVIEATSWGKLLCDVVDYLVSVKNIERDRMLAFRATWTKAPIFTETSKTNHRELQNGLFINCNNTALHSCWLLQDLLDWFDVDKSNVVFLIHRPCSAEPAHVKEYIENRFKKGMIEYLEVYHQFSSQNANAIIDVISRYLNPALTTISKSYTNFFLFDDASTLYNYVKRVRDKLDKSPSFKPEAKKIFNLALDCLVKYFKHRVD